LYKPEKISEILLKNLKEFGNPLGVPIQQINTWWKNLNLGKGSKLLFTGMIYQLAPYIAKITELLRIFEDTPFENVLHILPNTATRIISIPNKNDVQRYNGILLKIYSLLSKSDVGFYYDPALDSYTGIILHELGCDCEFQEHAKKVVERLEKSGVREIVTVDPHTTYALKKLYPQYTGVELEVFSYIELISASKVENECITLQDPCYYARYLSIYDQPRDLLRFAGIESVDVKNSKKITGCCGAPVESLSPKLSGEIAKLRYFELKETGCEIVTLCPLCLSNLSSFGDVKDIAEVLVKTI